QRVCQRNGVAAFSSVNLTWHWWFAPGMIMRTRPSVTFICALRPPSQRHQDCRPVHSLLRSPDSYEYLLASSHTDSSINSMGRRFAARRRGLAAMAGSQTRRAFVGNWIASGMDQGWPQVALASEGHRLRIFHAVGGRRQDLSA